MVMDNYYVQDRLQALWHKIDTLHLCYLEMEESPQKLDQRTKLEECIKEYLCLAPHDQKFIFRETAQVLHRSASNKKDFSGYKAATGWNAIQMYAGNLLAQPWRKEYRQINMYSGFYVHNIDANLVGAEIMFEIMGYKHTEDCVMVLDGPVCPDQVTNVSRDALMAYVECQILKTIWEEVSANFPITWLEVLEFRELHLCSPKQSIQSLNYRFHQKQYQDQLRSYSQSSDILANRHPTLNMHNAMTIPTNHSYPPLTGHTHPIPPLPAACMYGSNGCYMNNYSTYAPVAAHYGYPLSVQFPQIPQPMKPNNYCCANGYSTAPNYSYPVPTGQLIELEQPKNVGYDVVDSRQNRVKNPTYNNTATDGYLNRNVSNGESDKDDTFETWDYVYRNLENQGYSKDLGERGDLLSPVSNDRARHSIRKAKSTNLDEAMNNLETNDRPLKMTEALEKCKDDNRDKRKDEANKRAGTPTSSYENLSSNETKKQTKNSLSKPLAKKISVKDKIPSLGSSLGKLTQGKNAESKKTKFQQDLQKANVKEMKNESGEDVNKWQCKACTYLNDNSKDICDICSKSKAAVEQQMEIGGSQCAKCTLVNPRDAKVCQACSCSLKDSPTYI